MPHPKCRLCPARIAKECFQYPSPRSTARSSADRLAVAAAVAGARAVQAVVEAAVQVADRAPAEQEPLARERSQAQRLDRRSPVRLPCCLRAAEPRWTMRS